MNKSVDNNTSKHSGILLFILSLGFIMAVLDTTGVGLALPGITKYFSLTLSKSTWVMNAYVLALGSTMLLSGKLSSKFGNKKILIIGMLIFTISSLLSALSVSIYMLVVVRFFQGVGASLFMPSSMSLLYNAYPDDKKRAQMLGIWASIISVATGCGSFIGGTLINLFGWRGIFLINIPLGLLSIIYIFSSVKKNISNKSIKIDYIDNLLLIFSLTFIIGYLVEGKTVGYSSKNMMILLVMFLISFGILIYRELHSSNPIIPINLFYYLIQFLKFLI